MTGASRTPGRHLAGVVRSLGAGLESQEPKINFHSCRPCGTPHSEFTHCLSSQAADMVLGMFQTYIIRHFPNIPSPPSALGSMLSVARVLFPGPSEHAFLSPDWLRDISVRNG